MITKKENQIVKKFSALSMLLFGGALLSLGLESFFPLAPYANNLQASASEAVRDELRAPQNPFLNITLEARAVYVKNLASGKVLFAQNEQAKFPLASVTKLMTAFVARESMSESAVITITADDISAEGDSGLRAGERWRLGDLLNIMLLASSNDAAHAVAGFVGANGVANQANNTSSAQIHFIQMMNEKARVLGLKQTEFFNESGLDMNDVQEGVSAIFTPKAGGYGSAYDVALLFSELWEKYPETIETTAHKYARIISQDTIAHILPNTNEIVGHIPGLIASKTGYTALAGGNLAVIFDRGMGDPVLVVVLGSSYNGRFDDVLKLVTAARKAL
ncbi:MAG: D-alanyl-D-alanine carboxypeptidase [Candidatus Yonathbacteria bacterium]|nr:D-alanyl-D-alanine carboxypeptidase [Candidatus Yonathbacteria bacterium]